ncbi:hypothetical protein AC579_669 [Pseudocercospora musae]|uniref:Zn(2)-C6 fungal-type domain-containing protein n=1 Tax=Pseudocercospora musae TaxID=113226 RepID=A0A139IDS7_9PEZI|nr:hypothetical protein AC579_669 [Pseudocercospora musae]
MANILPLDTEMNPQANLDHLDGNSTHCNRFSHPSRSNTCSSPVATNTNHSGIDPNHKDDFSESCDPAALGTFFTPSDAPFADQCSDTMLRQASEEKLRVDSVFGQNHIHCESASTAESSNFSNQTNPQLSDNLAFHDFELSQRHLRPQCRQKKFTTTWLDTDTTGDYDPVEDERTNRLKRSRANARGRAAARSAHDAPSSSSTSSVIENSCSTEEAVRLPVTLNLVSTKGRHAFAQKIEDHEKMLQSDGTDEPGYRLRKRATKSHRPSRLEKLSDIDLTAKPLSRGCYACVTLYGTESDEHRCSLLDDEKSWPCQACVESTTDCELITSARRKRACQSCKRRRVTCSYTSTQNHSKRCDQCEAFDHHCIAGPVQAFIRPRKRYDRDWQDDPYPQAKRKKDGQPRPPLACLECRQEGARCEYLPDDDGHFRSACSKCLVETLPCTIYDRDQLARADSRAVVEAQKRHVSPSPRHRSDQEFSPRMSAGGTLCTILTSFSHPFIFNCDDDSQRLRSSTTPKDEGDSCHFCTEPSLPFFGLGQIETQVIDYPDSPGFVEMGAGYRSRGIENTRLCVVCTLRRMCVVMCDKHTMRPIADLAAFSLTSQEAAEEELLEGKLTSDDAEQFCSVCTRLATHECAAETGEETPGCGLRLCQTCSVTLERKHHGSLKSMLERNSVQDTGAQQSLVRADCELLREDGALFKHLRHTITQ